MQHDNLIVFLLVLHKFLQRSYEIPTRLPVSFNKRGRVNLFVFTLDHSVVFLSTSDVIRQLDITIRTSATKFEERYSLTPHHALEETENVLFLYKPSVNPLRACTIWF